MSLYAGVAKVNVTPPIGCLMSGYGGRTHGADGIQDELWARALYLFDGTTEIALVTVEVVGLPEDCVGAIRARVHAETGIPGEHVFLSATHTHSGPACRRGADELSNRQVASMEDKVAGALIWAKAQAQPVGGLYIDQAAVLCGVNRRERRNDRIVLGINPDGPVYGYADLLHVTDDAGTALATWFCHPCHAVTMGQSNYKISGDYPGAASRFVEANSGGMALFANGCAGNINSLPHNGTFDDVERLGRRLGSAVMQTLTKLASAEPEDTRITSRQHSFHLPLDPLPSLSEAEESVREAETKLAAAAGQPWPRFWGQRTLREANQRLELVRSGEPIAGAPTTVQVITIGKTAIIGLPAEVFIELAFEIQERSPFTRTIVAGYTNGYMGYVPTRAAFVDGGYEVDTARISYRGLRITPDAGDALVAGSLEALRQAWADVEGGSGGEQAAAGA